MDFGDSFDISEDDVDAEICDNPEAIDIADCIPAEAEVDKLSDLEDLGNIDSLEITSDVSPVDEPISDFELWKHEMDDLGAELTDDTLDALWEEPDNRSYQQTELVDIALHPDYEDQGRFWWMQKLEKQFRTSLVILWIAPVIPKALNVLTVC